MSFYQSKGLIPNKRHTVFKKDADSIYYEELISRKGFSGIYSNVYHLKMPTKINKLGKIHAVNIESIKTKHQVRHLQTKIISNNVKIVFYV